MEKLQLIDGLTISNHDISCICECCYYGKMCRSPFVENKREKREVCELIVTDIKGPMQVPSLSQAVYFLLIKDHGSGYRKCHFLKKKSDAAYSPQQNGVAERDNRTIMEACRSPMYGINHHVTSPFRLRLWEEAMAHAVYTLNLTLSRTGSVTPYQKYHGVKPSVSHIRGFGLLCYSHVPDEKRHKLDPKGENVFSSVTKQQAIVY
jgi:hypothetical protein